MDICNRMQELAKVLGDDEAVRLMRRECPQWSETQLRAAINGHHTEQ